MFHQSSKQILLGIFVALLLMTMPVYAVENFKISDYGGAHQIWFEVEDFDERDPPTNQYYPVVAAPGAGGYAYNTTIDFAGVAAKYVRLTANSNHSGGRFNQYGLSEVRFIYLPVLAREPNPASGATGTDVDNVALSWRAGRACPTGYHDQHNG